MAVPQRVHLPDPTRKSAKQAPDFPLGNVRFATYARLLFCTEEQLAEITALHPAYIIMDEFHRAGAERWGERVRELLELCPDAKLLGLTATNVRYLDNNRDMAEELFDGHIASEMTLGEAIVRGILPRAEYVTTVFRYQNELAKYQARVDSLRSPGVQDANQKYLEALRRPWNRPTASTSFRKAYHTNVWEIYRLLFRQGTHGRDGIPCAGMVRGCK